MPFASLLAPLTIRGLTVPNRIVMSPMTREASPAGVPGPDVAAYYARRAAGGVGLILTEGAGIPHVAAVDKAAIPRLHGDAALAGWRGVVESVHAAGGLIAPQLWHQGVLRDPDVSEVPSVSGVRPSGLWGPAGGMISLEPDYVARALVPTREMTEAEIAEIIAGYGEAAEAAVALGFDAIALHGAHGYLIDSFLWYETNRRTDRWGGGPRQRARFAAEVVRAVRAAVGETRPIFFRFSQFKMQDYGARLAETPAELEQILGPIADAGVDVFDGSQRYFDTALFPGSNLNLAGWAKKLTGKFAMTVGGVGLDKGSGGLHIDPKSGAANNLGRLAERFEAGEFDLVAVGRSLLNDADWLRKARHGEPFAPFDPINLTRLT
ncbi:MAG TPA: 12-oxophytodienoate reductase [Acetobacteraceae bacterium]|nr:12-oxophytodienoate reductase [Acetobacteraceae bacterium]